jgi:NAD(P)-dependent dehydrogenase (short-subunit alcohol dehydrogenase family)
MGLADKRVVILGGTSGIGLQVGKLAAAEGAHVVLASSSQTKVDRAKDAVPGAEGRTIDLLSQSNIKTFFAKIGAFDHLVYTAGDALLTEPMETLSLERAQAFFGVRFWGSFLAVKYARPNIRAGSPPVWRCVAPARVRLRFLRCAAPLNLSPGRSPSIWRRCASTSFARALSRPSFGATSPRRSAKPCINAQSRTCWWADPAKLWRSPKRISI